MENLSEKTHVIDVETVDNDTIEAILSDLIDLILKGA